MSTVRAKLRCNTVEMFSLTPQKVMNWSAGQQVETEEMTWSRTYRFIVEYDPSVPEDQRYCRATPSGELRIVVDNPDVSFVPGKSYYLDFTEVE